MTYDEGFDEKEAFAALLLVTIAVDGRISDDEVSAFNSVVGRMTFFDAESGPEFDDIVENLVDLLRRHGREFLLKKSVEALSPDLRETGFAIAADILIVRGVVDAQAQPILAMLKRALEIEDSVADRIVDVLKIKNRV